MMRRASVQVENFQAPVEASAEQATEQEKAAIQAQLDALAAASEAVTEVRFQDPIADHQCAWPRL